MFRNWVLQNFPYIEDDFDALTDYELFSKICGYVLEYSKDNEEMKKQIEEFQTYFDNLDVQEEINNKLDEMAEDGTLDEIINQNIFNELNDNFNNNKQGVLNIMNNIIYDIGDKYSQGITIKDNILYVYTDNQKLLEFNLTNNTFISELSVNLGHGNDLCNIGDYIYVATDNGTKKIIKYSITDSTIQEILLNIDEEQIASICKENNDNLLIIANNDYGTSFNNCQFYRYNLVNETLTKLSFDSDTYINFYAVQSIEYLKGYIYLLVNSPDQLIKIKVNDTDLNLENIYNLPSVDNLGLSIGEYEGISKCNIYGENSLMISSHIYDSEEIGRTLKCYIINPINNVPDFPLYYPNIPYYQGVEYRTNIYIDNTSSLIEIGTETYPFHTLARALNVCRNKRNIENIIIKNSASSNPYNLYADLIIDVNSNFNVIGSNVVINWQRILNSNIHMDNNTQCTFKNKVYDGKETYGTIVDSNLLIKNANFDVQDGINIYKSKVHFYSVEGTANNSDEYVFKLRYLSELTEGINWENFTHGTKKPYYLYGLSKLFKISDVTLTEEAQSDWFDDNIVLAGSNAYCVIFSGKHFTD